MTPDTPNPDVLAEGWTRIELTPEGDIKITPILPKEMYISPDDFSTLQAIKEKVG